MDESEPRVTRETMINHYGWTKAQAEKDALDADGSTLADGRTMATCAVRPCSGIFGHDDRMIIQRLVSEAPPCSGCVSRGCWRVAGGGGGSAGGGVCEGGREGARVCV